MQGTRRCHKRGVGLTPVKVTRAVTCSTQTATTKLIKLARATSLRQTPLPLQQLPIRLLVLPHKLGSQINKLESMLLRPARFATMKSAMQPSFLVVITLLASLVHKGVSAVLFAEFHSMISLKFINSELCLWQICIFISNKIIVEYHFYV